MCYSEGFQWDIIAITASNTNQAKAYIFQMKDRIRNEQFSEDVKFEVIADDEGKRIGSGGATLSVINKLNEKYGIDKKRILLIHSGGDSQRIPQYSASGKLFSPVLKLTDTGRPSTLFDEILASTRELSKIIEPGIVIMSGDVLTLFDSIDTQAFHADAVALTVEAPAQIGANHGVFCMDGHRITSFLHKQSVETLVECAAVTDGNVCIDTGTVYFSQEIEDKLCDLVKSKDSYDKFINETVRLNLYGDIIYPLASCSTLEQYLLQPAEIIHTDELTQCRKILWDVLKGSSFNACKLAGGKFIHFGTTAQFLKLVAEKGEDGLPQNVLCNRKNVCAYNSFVADGAKADGYVENSIIEENVSIKQNSVVSGAWLRDVDVPCDTVVSVVGLADGRHCLRVYPVSLNPKNDNIWTEKLFPIFDSAEECSDCLRHFLADDEIFKLTEKLSFKESFEKADVSLNLSEKISEMRRDYYSTVLKKRIVPRSYALEKAVCRTSLPLRVNYSGGWTDTPPYTNDYGGEVLNAAVIIGDQAPVNCIIQKIDKKAVIFESTDLYAIKVIDSIEDFFDFSPQENEFFIHKAVCIACGLITESTSLDEFLEANGGFKITTYVQGVPKGSGLGISSILCAAAARSMYEFMGISYTDAEIFSVVLTMEQIMGTCGGWQDQVGGYVPGIKLITAKPGSNQQLCVQKLNLPDGFIQRLQKRYFLVFTGQQRLARNLLKKVMSNIYESPEVFDTMNGIRQLTKKMSAAFISGNIDEIAKLMTEHWVLSNKLYSGTSNSCIEEILLSLENLLDGYFICGAGNGGFLQVIVKDGIGKKELDDTIARSNLGDTVKAYDVTFIQ